MIDIRRQRRIAIIVAVAALAVVAAGAWFARTGLREMWALRRLRAEPDLFESMPLSSDPILNAAVERYLREPAGRQRFLDLFIEEYARTVGNSNPLRPLAQAPATDLSSGILTLGESGYILRLHWGPKSRTSEVSMGLPPTEPLRRKWIIEHLGVLAGYAGRPNEFPHIEIEFVRVELGKTRKQSWDERRATSRHPDARPIEWTERNTDGRVVAFFRVLASDSVATDDGEATSASGAPPIPDPKTSRGG
jgi:hypothetical protein